VPCSTATSKENTVCINKTRDKTKECPITYMKFVTISEAATMDDDPDYKIYTVDDEHSFVTSKFKGDNLPLTSFKVEKKPCLDPTEVSTDT